MNSATAYLAGRLALVAALAVGASWAVHWQADQVERGQAHERLQRSAAVAIDARAQALGALQLRSEALAQDPAFVDYVVQSLQPNATLGGGIDRASISDLLNARRKGYDVAMVLDAQGIPAALDGVLLKPKASIQNDPLVTRALSTLKPTQGAWVYDGKLLWVTVNPLLRGGIVRGLLLTADRAGDRYPALIARHTGAAAGVLVSGGPGYVLAAQHGLPGWAVQALPDLASTVPSPDVLPVAGRTLAIPQDGTEHPGWVLSLPASGGRAMLVTLAGDQVAAIAVRGTRVLYGGVALLTLLAVMATFWKWWSYERPLQQLASILERAADGDSFLTARVSGSLVVRRLRDGLNQLLQRERAGGAKR